MVDWVNQEDASSSDENEHDWNSETNPHQHKVELPSTSDFAVNRQRKRESLLQESADDTLKRLSNQFPPVVEEGADTLIWLGEPPQQPGQDDYEYGHVRRQFQMPYLIKSETLRKLDSPKFNKFLGPMSARTERRLKKHAIHKLIKSPSNIKYYVDLSPVLNDEEAMVQLTQLTVPNGALAWHRMAEQFSINAELVCGRDDLDIPPRPIYNDPHGSDGSRDMDTDIETLEKKLAQIASDLRAGEQKLTEEKQKNRASASKPNFSTLPLEEEYTQLRHHTATARLLHAISGGDPKLDSAAKVWTFCMLANYFECASSSRISHWVISWLLQPGNVNFIQSLPDVAYRLGLVTQSGWLVRCTFAILVGQRAMLKGVQGSSQALHQLASKQLAIDCLDDDEINRIDHAAEVFSRRLRAIIDDVASFPGIWTNSNVSSFHLSKLRDAETKLDRNQQHLVQVMDHLKNYLRRVIYMTMSDAYPFDNKSLRPFKASTMFSAYAYVPRSLRFLTQFHWEVLSHEELHRDYLDTTNNHKIWENTCEALRNEGLLLDTHIPYVSKQTLYSAIKSLNEFIASPESNGLEKTPSSGEKRSEPDRSNTTEVDSPSKRSKKDESAETPYQASSELALCFRSIPQVPDRELVLGSSRTRKFVDEEGSNTEEDWEEVSNSDANKKAVRFLSIRSKSPAQDSRTSQEEIRLTNPEAYTASSTVSPGMTSKFKEMEINPKATDSDWEVTNLSHDVGRYDSFSRAPLTDGQKATTHVQSFMKQKSMRRPAHDFATSTEIAQPVSAELSDTATAEIHEAPPFRSIPKPRMNSPMSGSDWAIWYGDGIAPEGLLRDFSRVLSKKLSPLLVPGYVTDGSFDFDIPVDNLNTLLCLGEDEYKYLPLWAGGFDDGSGGVFDDGAEVPDAPDVADGGFRGGAMGIIPGVGSSLGGSIAGSEFEDLGTEVAVSTVGKASRYATDGTATETVMSFDD